MHDIFGIEKLIAPTGRKLFSLYHVSIITQLKTQAKACENKLRLKPKRQTGQAIPIRPDTLIINQCRSVDLLLIVSL